MANEGDRGQQQSSGGNGRPSELTALEERVARLEGELAEIQLQLAAQGVTEKTERRPAVAVRTAPPPPPPPPAPHTEAASPERLAAETWASARPAVSVPESRDSFESWLGSQILNRVAIVTLLIGTAYFLKLAVDRRWIVPSPTGKLIAGLIAGTALVLWSERFRRKGFAPFSYSLKAVGSGMLYLSLWAGFHWYHVLSTEAALGLMILVTAWNAFMAWAQDSELLAAYALAGGFATPMLLSTGGNHETFLFTYLLALDLATVALVRLKTWPRLLLGAFPLTVAFFIGWYSEFYVADELAVTSIFVALLGMTFASVPVARLLPRPDGSASRFASLSTLLEDILLPLSNAAFVALAGYSVLEDSGHHSLLPWLMIALAAAYLGVMQLPQTRTASAIHLSLAVVLLTIAIPLKASGHWITVSWLVEGLALLWVAARLETQSPADDPDGSYASSTLRWLGLTSLALGFCGVCTHLLTAAQQFAVPFLNKGTGTALTGVAVFAAVVWLALRTGDSSRKAGRSEGWGRIAMGALLLIGITAALMTTRELVTSRFEDSTANAHLAFQSGDFVTALMALAIFGGLIAFTLRLANQRAGEDFWMSCAALSTIAFNLIAVLTGVREIQAIWGASQATVDSALQQALAISAFLMLYGAVLLAAGFWRRSSFLRWQALVLLVFTIFKTFLYDMRNLSQGYRVVSFLGLGALLMAISFAYQKDWLHLRDVQDARTGDDAGHGVTK